ncbi:hypothetical protein [Streptomyces phaeolivaceus]|uniref:hypothetical protein n=1 Tax=Streptomyces phaeolivaceus TaxID=2653200 RepID=UPI00186A1A12|nr:hypothetical protein [Streptomyces phaeolivaceus]
MVVQGDTGYVFSFTYPGRDGTVAEDDDTPATRHSVLQVAAARVVGGRPHCDRDEPVVLDLSPAP